LTIRSELEERAGGLVARLTFDNPAKLNILCAGVLRDLSRLMESLSENAKLRLVILTGAGEKAFVGGAELETLGSLEPKSAREFITLIHEACAAMRDCPVPVVARINGWCLGAGLEIAACCDLRIAVSHANFGMPEVRLGIPSVVEAAMLPRLVGTGRARWLVMTGATIDAGEALSWGLVEKVFAPDAFDAEFNKAIDSLLAGEPAAMRAQKRLCKLWEEMPLGESVRISIDEFAKSYESGEPRKRIDAFRSTKKRK
jgi:enoyl-CoA hydratase/carnithine racemase